MANMEFKIENTEVYGLENSLRSAGNPLRVEIDNIKMNDEIKYWTEKNKTFLKEFYDYQKNYGKLKGLNTKDSCCVCGSSFHVQKNNNNMLSNIILNANPKNLSEFVYKYGIKSNKDIVHYLLKYTYLDNWETELEENYFGTCWSLIEKDKDIIYIDDYLLEYKKKQVLKDFYIDLSNFKTHRKVIYKINKMNK